MDSVAAIHVHRGDVNTSVQKLFSQLAKKKKFGGGAKSKHIWISSRLVDRNR